MHLIPTLLATVPATPTWGFTTAIVMLVCNLVAIAIGRFAIANPGEGPALPFPMPEDLFGKFGVPELLATTSLGHILGAGVILGLANSGML